jgi:hypothetical protein
MKPVYSFEPIKVRLIGGEGHGHKLQVPIHCSMIEVPSMLKGIKKITSYKICRYKNGKYYGRVIKQ